MGYQHIENLYKNQEIMLFRKGFALEKIHGTSAHVRWKDDKLSFYAGGANHHNFVNLFDSEKLTARFTKVLRAGADVTLFGEAHGGKLMGMSKTYGKELRFAVFDVKIDGLWLSVSNAADFTAGTGLQFVHYVEIPMTIEAIDAERDADSVQAVRNGMGGGHIREGVILRPPIEVRKNNDERIIAKHKRKEFMETKTERVVDPEQLQVLADAEAIADEWVTPMRLAHVIDKIPVSAENPLSVLRTKEVKEAMVEDVLREGTGEIVVSKEVCRAIATKAVKLFHESLKK